MKNFKVLNFDYSGIEEVIFKDFGVRIPVKVNPNTGQLYFDFKIADGERLGILAKVVKDVHLIIRDQFWDINSMLNFRVCLLMRNIENKGVALNIYDISQVDLLGSKWLVTKT